MNWPQTGVRFVAAAPIRQQAKDIYWEDLKRMVPAWFRASPGTGRGQKGSISESNLQIKLVTGNTIQVMGMEVPERVEGSPLAHIVCDEFDNMNPDAWANHISPALTDTQGSADIIGVPEGRLHLYKMMKKCMADDTGEWQYHNWRTDEVLHLYLGHRAVEETLPDDLRMMKDKFELGKILADRELSSARQRMDKLSYEQEYNAGFVNFQGRAYYGFENETHADNVLPYDPHKPLILGFDFNVDPGICVIMQEFERGYFPGQPAFTGVIDEIYIEDNSRTVFVVNKFLNTYENHQSDIYCFGDATGGARHSSQLAAGSDWDIIKAVFSKSKYDGRVKYNVPNRNPSERARVNAVNTRILTDEGGIQLRVCPKKAPKTVEDLESVPLKPDGSGEIDKKKDKNLTHLSDGLGYYIVRKFPVHGGSTLLIQQY